MFAPLVGGQFPAVFGWRAIFWLLNGFGVICLLAVLLRLLESNPPDRRIRAGLVEQLRGFGEILSNRMALGCISRAISRLRGCSLISPARRSSISSISVFRRNIMVFSSASIPLT